MAERTYLRTLAPACAVLLALACASLAWAVLDTRVLAQPGEWIPRYEVAIVIEADGSISVSEEIEYDFRDAEDRHGILRDLPTRFHYDDRYDRVTPIEILGVSIDGAPGEWQREDLEAGGVRLRIGDPDETVSGVHAYSLRYRVEGVLNGFPSHDELYWNAIGADWTAPIGSATVQVTAPAEVTEVACFAGPEGSSLECERSERAGDRATFAEDGLEPYEALTVVVAFPTGVVPPPEPILDERWSFRRAFSLTPWTAGATLLVGGLGAAVVGRLLWSSGRDRRWSGSAVDAVFGGPGGAEHRVPLFDGGPYPVEYTPPEGIRPGEIGTLRDERAHPLDVSATIVDLAVRGYLRIEELEDSDWRLTRLKPSTDLSPHERLLLDGLFEDGEEVVLSSLKQQFVQRLGAVQEALYKAMVEHGWYRRRPDRTRTWWLVGGVVALVAGAGLVFLAAAFTEWALVPTPLILGAIAIIGTHHLMPSRTARGTAMLRRVRGFERFIGTAEVYRARFAEDAGLLYTYLPYAIVFGLTEQWAKAFGGLDDVPAPAWYVGAHPFHVAAFSSSMQSFASSSAGTIASSPASSGSSGFGGGGFSGGGFGGGGGGSW